MYKLSHTNVMSLTGVCVDASGGPAIVMPYMANGSVLHYLKREREKLVLPEYADPEVVSLVFHQCTNALAGVFLLPQSPYCHGKVINSTCGRSMHENSQWHFVKQVFNSCHTAVTHTTQPSKN